MAYLYTDLVSKIKLILNVTSKKIGIGNTAQIMSYSGDSRLSGITLSSTFKGSYRYDFIISVASGETEIYGKLVQQSPGYLDHGSQLLGDSAITVDYVTPDELITIPKTAWVGIPVNGETISFTTSTDLTENDLENYLDDYLAYLISRLRKVVSLTFPAKTGETGVDIDGTILEIIKRGTAFRIFSDLFMIRQSDSDYESVNAWNEYAESMISKILSGEIIVTEVTETETATVIGKPIYNEKAEFIYDGKGIVGIEKGRIDLC